MRQPSTDPLVGYYVRSWPAEVLVDPALCPLLEQEDPKCRDDQDSRHSSEGTNRPVISSTGGLLRPLLAACAGTAGRVIGAAGSSGTAGASVSLLCGRHGHRRGGASQCHSAGH